MACLGKPPGALYMATDKVFTGIVQTTGMLRERDETASGVRLVIATNLGPLAVGESVCVHGVCLTVQAVRPDGFEADVSPETLARTTLGRLPTGSRLHLERALALSDRLGGHLLTGHIDGAARVREREVIAGSVRLVFELGVELLPFIAPKGSVALDGVSLTVNRVDGARFEVMIIPHTHEVTVLGALAPDDEVNVEVDLIARYVARLLGFARHAAST